MVHLMDLGKFKKGKGFYMILTPIQYLNGLEHLRIDNRVSTINSSKAKGVCSLLIYALSIYISE